MTAATYLHGLSVALVMFLVSGWVFFTVATAWMVMRMWEQAKIDAAQVTSQPPLAK